MKTYTIEAVKRTYLTTTVVANSIEEAYEKSREYIIDDFEETGTDFTYTHVMEG